MCISHIHIVKTGSCLHDLALAFVSHGLHKTGKIFPTLLYFVRKWKKKSKGSESNIYARARCKRARADQIDDINVIFARFSDKSNITIEVFSSVKI